MRAFSLGLVLLVALAAPGCGGEDGDGGDADAAGTDSVVTPDSVVDAGPDGDAASDSGADSAGDSDAVVPTAVLDAAAMNALCAEALTNACAWVEQCQAAGFSKCSDWPGYANFEKSCAGIAAAITSGAVEVSAARAAECRASFVAPSCKEWPPPIFDPPCRGLATPRVAVGGECKAANTWASQCVGGYCGVDADACGGKCRSYAATGASCPNYVECDPLTAYCDAQKCTAWGADGQSCESTLCGAGLRCDPVALKCIVPKPVGASCERSAQCERPNTCSPSGKCAATVPIGGDCDSDANCPAGAVCVHLADPGVCFELASTGEPCPAPGSGGCVEDHICARTGDSDATTCQRFGRDGDPCSDGVPCAQGFYCDRTPEPWVCRPVGGPGDPCNSASNDSPTIPCLPGLSCVADQCRSPGVDGAVCNPGYQGSCAEGFWCDDVSAECKAAGAASAPCAPYITGSCAAPLWCAPETSTCQPPSALGGPCFTVWTSCDAATYCGCPAGQTCELGPSGGQRCLAKKSDDALCNSTDECIGGSCLSNGVDPPRCTTPVPPPVCDP
ncbi:MAG: hypothetical protein R3F39_20480 [Myxococcota bacterium]